MLWWQLQACAERRKTKYEFGENQINPPTLTKFVNVCAMRRVEAIPLKSQPMAPRLPVKPTKATMHTEIVLLGIKMQTVIASCATLRSVLPLVLWSLCLFTRFTFRARLVHFARFACISCLLCFPTPLGQPIVVPALIDILVMSRLRHTAASDWKRMREFPKSNCAGPAAGVQDWIFWKQIRRSRPRWQAEAWNKKRH